MQGIEYRVFVILEQRVRPFVGIGPVRRRAEPFARCQRVDVRRLLQHVVDERRDVVAALRGYRRAAEAPVAQMFRHAFAQGTGVDRRVHGRCDVGNVEGAMMPGRGHTTVRHDQFVIERRGAQTREEPRVAEARAADVGDDESQLAPRREP